MSSGQKVSHHHRGFAKGVAGTVSLPNFFPFSSVFFRLLPFSSVFFRFFFPFSSFSSVSCSEKKKNGETPFARPLLRNPDITGAAGKPTFWCGRPRFLAQTFMTRRVLEEPCTENVCIDFLAPRHDEVLCAREAPEWIVGDQSLGLP